MGLCSSVRTRPWSLKVLEPSPSSREMKCHMGWGWKSPVKILCLDPQSGDEKCRKEAGSSHPLTPIHIHCALCPAGTVRAATFSPLQTAVKGAIFRVLLAIAGGSRPSWPGLREGRSDAKKGPQQQHFHRNRIGCDTTSRD